MQVQVVPVEVARLGETIKIFMQTARAHKLKFSEVGENDGSIDDGPTAILLDTDFTYNTKYFLSY